LDDVPGAASDVMEDSNSEDESESDADHDDAGDDDIRFQRSISSSSSSSAAAGSTSGPAYNPFSKVGSASSARKQSLWHDPADDSISVNMADDKRLRKLSRGKEGESSRVQGKELEKRLRGQFEKVHPTPEWASKSARKVREKDAAASSINPLDALLASTGTFLSVPTRRGLLAKGSLEVERLRDANFQSRTEGKRDGGGILQVKFHTKVNGALAVIGGDRRLRMFNIDGHTNPSLLTVHIPSLPVTTAHFHPSGSSLYLAGPRPFYYTYDLATQRCIRSPKSLFGNTTSSQSANASRNLEKVAFSPDGSVLAVAGRRGVISLIAWAAGGAGQLVGTLNSGRTGGIRDLVFMKGGRELWVLGEGSEVDIWDMAQRRCVARWRDEGGFGGANLVSSQDGEYCSVGATTGVVNVYSASTITESVEASMAEGSISSAAPKPIRGLMNLTTAPTTIAFNHDSQMMVTASNKKKDALKVYHLPSATAFSNWPTSSTPLGVVTSADFSAGSEFLAIGNARGKVLLYSLTHYRGSS